MSEMQIRPYQGIGVINFGMSREEVRNVVNASFREFRKTSVSVPADTFPSLGLHVYYNRAGACDAVEAAFPANPIIVGQMLIGVRFRKLLDWFGALDPAIQTDECGLTSFRFGVGLYVPSAKNLDIATVEGVIVFVRGYYD